MYANNRSERSKREVAQLVAHYVRDVGVACSSHVFSTKESSFDGSFCYEGLKHPCSPPLRSVDYCRSAILESRLLSHKGTITSRQKSSQTTALFVLIRYLMPYSKINQAMRYPTPIETKVVMKPASWNEWLMTYLPIRVVPVRSKPIAATSVG